LVDRDLIATKIATIERCLARIERVRSEPSGRLDSIDVDDITALNLQRSIQAGIDLAAHVVATEGWGVPAAAGEAFDLLSEHSLLDRDLASRLRRMAAFRNIAIHEYRKLDPRIVETVVTNHLGDLRDLVARVIRAFELERPGI